VAATDLTGGVAVRMSALCLSADGSLGSFSLWDDAARGALLLDLALAGRLESLEDSIVVDAEPTGFPPADALLAAIGAEPERALDGWLAERRLGLRHLAAANVGSGRWSMRRDLFARRRYVDLRSEATRADARRARDTDPVDWTPADACVMVLAAAASLRIAGPAPDAEAVLPRTGPAAWLGEAVLDHLRLAAMRYGTEASGLSPF
jgi:hypothetical protein